MLRFGFFEDFMGCDTVLIWGDEEGLSHLQRLFAELSMGGLARVAVHAIEGSVEACCSAKRFGEFADKVASLLDPNCRSGHHYLDWPGAPDTQIMVSKGAYPEGLGTTA